MENKNKNIMQRSLLFFDLILEKDSRRQLDMFGTEVSLKDKVENLSKEPKKDDLIYINNNVVIQIEDLSRDYLFGSYGKTPDLNKRSFIRARAIDDFEVIDIESLKQLVENYTYFFLDLNKNECVVLNNPKCGGFKNEFSLFLLHHFRVSGVYENIQIVNKLSEKIEEDIGKANYFSSISYTYTSEKLPANEFINFKEISGIKNRQIRTASVQLYLEPEIDYSENAKKLSNTANYIDDFEKLKIDTVEESINVIEKILSKKVSINIDEDEINNLGKVKELLMDNLTNH